MVKKTNREAKEPKAPTPPGEGERRAQRGFQNQYRQSAALIYSALLKNELNWVGLADPDVGILDDLVLGLGDKVVGHQFKSSQFAEPFRLKTLLIGGNGILKDLIGSWAKLQAKYAGEQVEIRFLTTDYPSTTDSVAEARDEPVHSAALLAELARHSSRSLADWQATKWAGFFDELSTASGLDETAFSSFLSSVRIASARSFDQIDQPDSAVHLNSIVEIARVLPELVADASRQLKWSREELLKKLRWSDAIGRRRVHTFPIGEHVQRNEKTEKALLTAIANVDKGYISVLGPPGTGKSTLLQSGLQASSDMTVIRYFAFLPGESHGLGRAEAEDFIFDLVGELKRSGLQSTRVHDSDLHLAREHFENLLNKASDRFQTQGTKTVIVVDGLDHIPREEVPVRSLLCELPRADAVPIGVLFVLGSQHLHLDGLQSTASEQAAIEGRCIHVEPLSRESILTLVDASGIDVKEYGEKIYALSKGHPLAARYVIEALKGATTEAERRKLLDGEIVYDGDIKRIYDAAWKDVSSDPQVRKVLAYVARSEGPICPSTISELVSVEAVERAYASTSHLLNTTGGRWSVFHNSFRLFLLEKHELRLGRPDPDYPIQIYRDLAIAASRADPYNPQSWLELRYHDKAGDFDKLIHLATPALFREQLARGRSAGDIQVDIRLAFKAIKAKRDTVKTVELLLARHEVNRRADVLSQAESIVDTYIQLGDYDRARALLADGGPVSKPYELIDELLEAGRIDEARALFEEVEPLAHFDPYLHGQESELDEWAGRVHHFRNADQIIAAIAKLTAKYPNNEQERERRVQNLRFEVARSSIIANCGATPHDIASALGLEVDNEPYLAIEAANCAWDQNDPVLASQQLSLALPNVLDGSMPRGWRRRAARQAFRLGDIETAKVIFETLDAPTIADLDRSTGDPSARSLCWAIVEHSALSAALDQTTQQPAESQHAVHNAFQTHLVEMGRLLGHAWKGQPVSHLIASESVKRFVAFLNNVSPGTSEHSYRVTQILYAAPLLVDLMTQIGRLYGAEAYDGVQTCFDGAVAKFGGHFKSVHIRQRIALSAFKLDGDNERATKRLEEAIPVTADENTPAEQVEIIASFAKAFATIGNPERARELLASVHAHTLGYEIAAKKDPQYVLWRDVFERSCAADPIKRQTRIAFLCKLLAGMSKTEGSGAAYRLTSSALKMAALEGPKLAAAVMQHLVSHGVVTWTGLLNSVLCGIVTRRPDIATVVVHVWARLVLPFYQEPHYHEDDTGQFITVCIEKLEQADVPSAIELLSQAIEAESGDNVRTALLECLIAAAQKRGHSTSGLESALDAWKKAAPPPRDRSSDSDKFILLGVSTLEGADERLGEDSGELDYRSGGLLGTLVENCPIDDTLKFFERRPTLLKDSRLRFKVATAAIQQGRPDEARSILKDYDPDRDERSYWNPWYGGAKLEHHKLLVALDGQSARENAATAFADDLSRGRENILSLLPDLSEVIEVIDGNPDWPRIWDELVKYLSQFRDYELGTDIALDDVSLPTTDEQLLVSIFKRAFALELPEVDRQARLCAIGIAALPMGEGVFETLTDVLIQQGASGPAEAMCLFGGASGTASASHLFAALAQNLADHPDVAVSASACRLAGALNIPLSENAKPLPGFYKIAIPDEERGEDYDPPPGVASGGNSHLITSPLDYTFALQIPIRILSDASGLSHMHIRMRCGHYMAAFGGVSTVVRSEKQIRSALDNLRMRMTYNRPLMAAAILCLRQVACEIHRAGLISGGMLSLFLHRVGFPAVGAPPIAPSPRPEFVSRPNLDDIGYGQGQAQWLDGVREDVVPLRPRSGSILAELTTFKKVQVGRVVSLERLTLNLRAKHDWSTLDDAISSLPRMVGFKAPQPIGIEPSPSSVRQWEITGPPAIPEHLISLCPVVAHELGWSPHHENPFLYVDADGQPVVRMSWWRDGSPRDFSDDVVWGEGCCVILTPEGLRQYNSRMGDIHLHSMAWRTIGRGDDDAPADTRMATSH